MAKKLLYKAKDSWFIVPTTKEIKAGDGKIAADSIEVKVDPRAEWNEVFAEAWRTNRDYFYDPGMHGVDWKAARAKYAALLPNVTTRGDLNRVVQWMASELSVGHHRLTSPGDVPAAPKAVPGGLLGADYAIENGRYRFRKVYGGLNFNPELRSPLTEPGVNVQAGEYLLAVNGRDLRSTTNLFSLFENTSGKIVELTVGPNADGSGSRTVQVVPIATELALRNRDWVEANLRKVDRATNGRVAYVYVPNTAEPGHAYFKRYFYPQAHKDAVIIDERFNGGGQVADYYIDALRRPLISHWAMRYGADLKTPTASIQGPKVMIIDETAGSGGDLLPWMFRKFKLGPIVGKRTWGGLVGILGFPEFIDGGRDHRSQPRDLDGGRLGRRKRGRAAGHRRRADARRRDRRPRSAAREGDRDRAGRAQENAAAGPEASTVQEGDRRLMRGFSWRARLTLGVGQSLRAALHGGHERVDVRRVVPDSGREPQPARTERDRDVARRQVGLAAV